MANHSSNTMDSSQAIATATSSKASTVLMLAMATSSKAERVVMTEQLMMNLKRISFVEHGISVE